MLDAERLLAGPAVPQVPGLAAHAAAEAQVIGVRVMVQQFLMGQIWPISSRITDKP